MLPGEQGAFHNGRFAFHRDVRMRRAFSAQADIQLIAAARLKVRQGNGVVAGVFSHAAFQHQAGLGRWVTVEGAIGIGSFRPQRPQAGWSSISGCASRPTAVLSTSGALIQDTGTLSPVPSGRHSDPA